ncbi:MAG: hydrolase TatD [Parcubacteria group bacterium]|nr:MAG: hydrolase TatD [Parcubacteria group bacterium]
MLVDSHAHLNFKAYNDDREEVVGRCRQIGMKVINIGAALASSQSAVDLALSEPEMYAAVGLHPIHVFDEQFKISDYQGLIKKGGAKVVAAGESGFDYHHLPEILAKGAASVDDVKKKQEEVFRQHIALARENNLALVVHGRNGKDEPAAYQDIYRVLKDESWTSGVMHCFGGSESEAKQFVEHGFYLGFTGIITFDKIGVLEEIVKWIPLEKMLIETDAPYLTPEPHRGKRNEPAHVRYVAEKIAQIRGKTTEEIIAITGQNAINLFKL